MQSDLSNPPRRIAPDQYESFAKSESRFEQEMAFVTICLSSNVPPGRLCNFVNDIRDIAMEAGKTSPSFLEHIHGVTRDALQHQMQHRGLRLNKQLSETLKAIAEAYRTRGSLHDVTPVELRQIRGIGHKISRYFALSFLGWQVGVLDVHLLAWLREDCGHEYAPVIVPAGGTEYCYWEGVLMHELADRFPNDSIATADLLVWSLVKARRPNLKTKLKKSCMQHCEG